MLITFQCPSCGEDVDADATTMGGAAACPHCSENVSVPRRDMGPDFTIGGFKIIELLGKGSMGQVYLANQLSMDRQVALKILPVAFALDEELVGRFLNEVRLAARLDHPNVVTAHEAGEDNGVYFMAMAYMKGQTLRQVLADKGAFSEIEALNIVRKIAQALEYAWTEHRMIHRDVKPSNIILDHRFEPQLMDLGLSKSLDEAAGLTLSSTAIGTPNYISPEQIQGADDIDFRADMYSLGATLYHMVTAEEPYKGKTIIEILRKHVSEPLTNPQEYSPEISENCVALLNVMLAKEPRLRHPDWSSLIDDIDRVLRSSAPAAAQPPDESALIDIRPRQGGGSRAAAGKTGHGIRKVLSLATWAIVAAVVVLVLVTFMGKKKPSPESPAAAQAPPDIRQPAPVNPNVSKSVAERMAALQAVNPNIKGRFTFSYRDGKSGPVLDLSGNKDLRDISALKGMPIAELHLRDSKVGDLSPLTGMPLEHLDLNGCANVVDLEPLRGMDLKVLGLSNTGVINVYPLKDMQLERIELGSTKVTDISPLGGMPIKWLSLGKTGIPNLEPLRGMPLNNLNLWSTSIRSLSPLEGMPLNELDLMDCHNVTDLSPLEGMPLERLYLGVTGVSDLSPLAGMPLLDLHLGETTVADLSPLSNAPLQRLNISQTEVTDLGPLRGAPLETLAVDSTGIRSIDALDGAPLQTLSIARTRVADLAPIMKSPIHRLNLWNTPVTDLEPLSKLPLVHLDLSQCTKLTELEALAGTPLEWLSIDACTGITDLSPLVDTPLNELRILGATGLKDIEPLTRTKTLVKLAADPWHYGTITAAFEDAVNNDRTGEAIREGNRLIDLLTGMPCFAGVLENVHAQLYFLEAEAKSSQSASQ